MMNISSLSMMSKIPVDCKFAAGVSEPAAIEPLLRIFLQTWDETAFAVPIPSLGSTTNYFEVRSTTNVGSWQDT
jgi:hypothetical protein